MRIAQVPPLYESVPPKLYGGTERVVSYLTEELVKQGHDVTLFGTEDSMTKANLHAVCKQATRLNEACIDPIAWHIYQMQIVMENANEFDIIHFHNDYLHFPLSYLNRYRHVTTLHGRLDLDDIKPIYQKFYTIPVVSISDGQRKPLPFANWVGTVYHGLPKELYKLGEGKGDYLAFLGRISPEKRPDRAIQIAKLAGIKLKIAAKVDNADKEYFETKIKPLLDHPLIDFIGEIGEDKKGEFLGNAMALLFPIDWPEPFGMVMIEAMANGTPVIAWDQGSVPEVVEHGKTGFIVNDMEQAVEAVESIHKLSRPLIRKIFEHSFTASVMANKYMQLYERICEKKKTLSRRPEIDVPFRKGKFNSIVKTDASLS
ncbi:glycosyltransferase family 4 protein [Longitalea luteola]|uniref:glycosyltransferase family 4 protein n=1 Tax=Longitalea luteola TaxID=2812563 RepID=UPI001A95ED86|nr:glycosyltransferase family 4 protein [Longitalea luteola]